MLRCRDMASHGENEKCNECGVSNDDAKAETRKKANVTLLLRLQLWQLGTAPGAIDTGALVSLVGAVARLRVAQSRLHALEALIRHGKLIWNGLPRKGLLSPKNFRSWV